MNTNTDAEDFGTNNANTVIKPRRHVLDLEPFVAGFIRTCLKQLTPKKVIGFTLAIMAAFALQYGLVMMGLL